MTPKEVVIAYVAALNDHDPEGVCAWVSGDFFNEHTSARGRSVTGRSAYRDRLPGFFGAFPGLRYDIEGVVADGGQVAVAYHMSAQYSLPPAPPRPFALKGVFWFEVRDDLITHRVDYHDGLTFEQQVGGGMR